MEERWKGGGVEACVLVDRRGVYVFVCEFKEVCVRVCVSVCVSVCVFGGRWRRERGERERETWAPLEPFLPLILLFPPPPTSPSSPHHTNPHPTHHPNPPTLLDTLLDPHPTHPSLSPLLPPPWTPLWLPLDTPWTPLGTSWTPPTPRLPCHLPDNLPTFSSQSPHGLTRTDTPDVPNVLGVPDVPDAPDTGLLTQEEEKVASLQKKKTIKVSWETQ